MTQTISIAQRVLSESFDCDLSLQPIRTWNGHKSAVLRCRVAGPSTSLPDTVIVKQSTCGAAVEDMAAALFLEPLPHQPPLAPRCYGGDLAIQMVVLEDLGDGDSPNTLEHVLGPDPDAAAAALIDHIRQVAQLHAATAGRQAEYARIRAALRPIATPKPLYQDPWSNARGLEIAETERRQACENYGGGLRAVGLTVPAGVIDEIEMVTDQVEVDPGPFLVFCQGDVNTPGHCVRQAGGLRLFDFDAGGFRHAFLEGLAGRLTWGCMSRIPTDVVGAMDRAYRTALAERCADVREDAAYQQAVVMAAARWHIFHVVWRLPTARERDYLRGLSTLRQQMLAWLDAFVEVVDLFGQTPHLGSSARALAGCLRVQWPAEAVQLPSYPAFRR
jgi:hypothetical protein